MHSIRSNLTRLKTSAEKHLPDEEDLFGYPGINKAGIVAFIEDAHAYSYKLAELEPKFEITILKRKVSPRLDSCKNYISHLEKNKNPENGFNDFLNDLTSIRYDILLAYTLCVDKGFRTEAYALSLKEKVDVIHQSYENTKDELDALQDGIEKLDDIDHRIQTFNETTSSAINQAQGVTGQIQNLKGQAEAAFAITDKLEKEIKSKEANATRISNKIGETKGEIAEVLEEAKRAATYANEAHVTLVHHLDTAKQQQEEIQNTLDSANRSGMAHSFQKRKDELRFSLVIWGITFVLSVSGIFLSGLFFIVKPLLTDPNKTVFSFEILLKFLLVTPLVWLGWVSARQFGFLSRIREDYAYKFATALAFEGYRKQAKEISPELELKLIQISIYHFSQNPIRLYSASDNHATPLTELLKDLLAATKESLGKIINKATER